MLRDNPPVGGSQVRPGWVVVVLEGNNSDVLSGVERTASRGRLESGGGSLAR